MEEKASNNATPKTKIQKQFHYLEELLNCQICYCKAHQPTLCPHCSKLFCNSCILKSLNLKAECPNCRQSIKTPLTDCSRFLNELTSLMGSLFEQEQQIQKCREHGISLNYFCVDCKLSCCCQCKMFGSHQSHNFKNMDTVYK